jgi:hypothetical protein
VLRHVLNSREDSKRKGVRTIAQKPKSDAGSGLESFDSELLSSTAESR